MDRRKREGQEVSRRENVEPINIIEIHTIKGSTNKSQYMLKKEQLKKLLEPIKNTEVVVIAVVGQSRRGKSFLLNYMCRFLADYKNINGWMGDGNQALEGFGWKSCADPQTFGLWLSKPFIVKQSNGKEIAVLLMDTQGLFDDLYTQRDWSTIVGISLLVSSCLIVNVFTDISDDILTTFNSYIDYGLKAAEANAGTNESIPFQTLLFLIRDWNTPNQYKFGLTGGKQYLEKKLIVRDNQSEVAQNVRKNIQKCFKDFLCFLMPPFGEVMEREDFNGSFGQLRDRFKEKLKEFISTLLNPEELVPKTIDGNPITGEELFQQFQAFVEIFNREELPESHQILEAKAKLSDSIIIRKLRDLHLSQLRAFIQTKPFITRNDLRERNEVYKTEIIEDFETSMKSNNPKLVDKLYDILKINFEIIFKENEEKRVQYVEEKRDLCGQEFMDALNKELQNNGFVESETLEELFKTLEKKAFDSFNQCFCGEVKNLFERDLFELTMFINHFEKATRAENYRRIREFEKSKESLIENVVQFYNENMKKLLEDNIYLSKENFKETEKVIRNKTDSKFRKEYNFGNPSANETFFLKVDQKLNESKGFFKEKNQIKCENVLKDTQTVVSNSIDNYRKEMEERLYLINSVEDLDKSHEIVYKKVNEFMQNRLPFKAPYFITDYIESFKTETLKLFDGFQRHLLEKIESLHNKYSTALNEAKDHYIDGMCNSLEDKDFLSTEELNKIHKQLRVSALKVYESHFVDNKGYDPLLKNYQLDLKELIDEKFDGFVEQNEQNRNSEERIVELAINQSINRFNTSINQVMDSADNEGVVNNLYSLKEELKKQMSENTVVSDKSLLNKSLFKLENSLDQSLDDFKSKLEEKKALILKDYQNKVIQSNEAYKQTMNEMIGDDKYITDEELEEFNETIKNEIISELTKQLKPSFGLEVNQFIEDIKQFISVEYQTYFIENQTNRHNICQNIQTLSEQFVNEYKRRIDEVFDLIQTQEEFLAKHSRILEDILQSSRTSCDSRNKKYLAYLQTHIESAISKLFEEYLSEFCEKLGIFNQTYNTFVENSKIFHKTKMDELFANNEIYPLEDLERYQMTLRAQTVTHFEKHFEDMVWTSEALKRTSLKELNQFIDESNPQYIERNNENKLILDQRLKQLKQIIEQKYSETMNSVFESVLSEDDLNSKHIELMDELLTAFNDGIQLMDMTLLEPYQKTLQTFMKNELFVLQKKLNEKLNKIIISYGNLSKLLISDYIQEMENIILSQEIFDEEDFEGLHGVYSIDKMEKFEDHLKDNPCSETQTYFIQFKQTIDEEFAKLKERFQLKRELKLQKLEIALKDFQQMYEDDMKDNTNNIRKIEDLRVSHQNVKEKLIRIFRESYRFRDESKITPYIEILEESFDHSLADFEDILEFKIQKIETLTKNLRLDVRRYYKEEMQKFFQNKMFVQKQVLIKCHNFLIRNTIERFRPEKGELTEESFKQLVEESITDIFVKIEEENEMKRPTESPAIGIDLGTTNSCVAFFNPDSRNANNIAVIPNEFGNPTTPSVVSYRDNSIICVGEVAKDEIHSFPKNTISSVKRLIGRHFNDESVQKDMELWSYKVVDDENNNPKVSVKVDGQDQVLYPEQISAKVLKKMKEIAESHLGCEVTKAVITVPAYFNDGQKEATKDAGRLAGLEVLRIINEPTAAAIAFKVDRNEETEIRKVLIFDFGGGTFDVSILEINRGKIIVRAVGGDNHLGGDDFDTNIVKYCLEEFYKECNVKVEGEEGVMAMCRLRNKCEENKKKLAAVQSTVIWIDNFYKRNDLRVVLTRDKFEELNHHLFVRSIDLVKRTLESKDINPLEIDDVVLVGGSTRIPKIQEMLSQFFGGKPLNHWVNPDEAVAKGAAIQAAYLNGQQMDDPIELEDVTPLSLGIRIKGGKMSVIIPRNSPVPTTIKKQYFTSEDYQTVVGIKIFEGEKEMANDNHMLGQFDLSGIPSSLQGEQPIDVTFSVNDEGILHVIGKIVSTGGEKDIEITEHKGRLTKELIEQLLLQENPTFGNLFKQ